MVLTLGNLLVDILMHIEGFPVEAGALQGVSRLVVGPGGACNVAIMASRFGLLVSVLGEVGDDYFGQIVMDGLSKEDVSTAHVVVNENGPTPVAGVLVDAQGEPGYLGYPGEPALRSLPPVWHEALQKADAVFADGWIEHQEMAGVLLEALGTAKKAGAVTFFDPGPGNPRQENSWHGEVAALVNVVLATESEISRITDEPDSQQAARRLLGQGPSLVVVKRGAAGCILYSREEVVDMPGLPLKAVDATGAGDSLAGAVIYGCLNKLSLEALAILANATGTAKVLKIGTGHQVPTTAEIRAILNRFELEVPGWH